MQKGEFYYYDSLLYQDKDWSYCTNKDRRFYTEIKQGLRPEGKTLITNNIDAPQIPQGTYDLGDGYYDPVRKQIFEYNGKFMRDLEEKEVNDKVGRMDNSEV